MPFYMEHLGVIVGAISGALAAEGKRIDLFGVTVLALVTALGGGTIRDTVLDLDEGVFWIASSSFVITATLTGVATFFVVRFWRVPNKLFMIADAVVLAMFTMLGASKALLSSAGPVNAVVLGVITGVAGGILRDVLVGQIPVVFRRETYYYATAAFAGATLFVLLEHWLPGKTANRFIGIGLILAIRVAAIQWKLGLPVFTASTENHDE
jgi:uncharacterized membrane protein YeiH